MNFPSKIWSSTYVYKNLVKNESEKKKLLVKNLAWKSI